MNKRADEIAAFLDTAPAQRILRFMCFELAKEAHLWGRLGEDIPHQAQAEQAYMMTKMLKHAAAHGEGWIDAYNADRTAALKPIKALGAAIKEFGEIVGIAAPMTEGA